MHTLACLVDVYDTIVSYRPPYDVPALAGVAAEEWDAEYGRIEQALNAGRLSEAEGFERVLRACGVEPRPGLVRELMDRDRELLLGFARLYQDAVPFLRELRSRGIKIAIVSNCTAPTRGLLDELGVSALADVLVLSCEVRAVKPSAQIFLHALGQLGVAPGAALFVDDQPAYCAGATALGIPAVQIVRGEPGGQAPAPGATVVRSLPEVEAMIRA